MDAHPFPVARARATAESCTRSGKNPGGISTSKDRTAAGTTAAIRALEGLYPPDRSRFPSEAFHAGVKAALHDPVLAAALAAVG